MDIIGKWFTNQLKIIGELIKIYILCIYIAILSIFCTGTSPGHYTLKRHGHSELNYTIHETCFEIMK